ncbi:MAG: cell division protein FtsB [Gammaproteobacteria bacterium]
MKWLAIALLLVVTLLQHRLWLSDDGVRDLGRLKAAVAAQRAENQRLTDRNLQLAAEVRDLKSGMAALEERARSELGMVADGETFYQVVPPSPPAENESGTRTAAR